MQGAKSTASREQRHWSVPGGTGGYSSPPFPASSDGTHVCAQRFSPDQLFAFEIFYITQYRTEPHLRQPVGCTNPGSAHLFSDTNTSTATMVTHTSTRIPWQLATSRIT